MGQLVKISTENIEPVNATPRSEIILSGKGEAKLWENVNLGNGKCTAGQWHGDVVSLTIAAYPHDEVFTLKEGEIELLGDDGEFLRLLPGDSAFVPRGWAGTWNTVKPSTKVYVIYQS